VKEAEEPMKTTLSIIKADIGSIGGHIRPSERLIQTVINFVAEKEEGSYDSIRANLYEFSSPASGEA
jgi:fructose 1,6-bisphosphatase